MNASHRTALSEERRRHSPLRLWISRHKGWFTFAGALIVFGTFVVKEVLKENLKDLMDALMNAQTVFELRDDNIAVRNRLSSMDFRIQGIYDKLMTPVPTSDAAREFAANLNAIQENSDELELLDPMILNLNELVERIPHDPEREAAVENCRAVLARARAASKHAASVIGALSTNRKYQQRPRPFTNAEQGEMARAIAQTVEARQAAFQAVRTGTLNILEWAQSFRKQKEHQYERWTWVSYGLYALGWTVGLFGKLYGVAVQNEE